MEALNRLGLPACAGIPVDVLMSETFIPETYGVPAEQAEKISALREVVAAYMTPAEAPRKVTDSLQAADLFRPHLAGLNHEELWVALFTSSLQVIDVRKQSDGSLNACSIDNRGIVALCLSTGAACVMIAHNHPSGDVLPSAADVRATESLRNACKVFDILLTDHLVMGRTEYYSFSDEKKTKYRAL